MSVLKVRVLLAGEDGFVGEANSVSGVNSVGAFDVLPGHAQFVTYVEKGPLSLVLADGTAKKIEFELAILHVHSDQVDVFINPIVN